MRISQSMKFVCYAIDVWYVFQIPRQLSLELKMKASSIFKKGARHKNKNVMYFIYCDRLARCNYNFSGFSRLNVYLQSLCFLLFDKSIVHTCIFTKCYEKIKQVRIQEDVQGWTFQAHSFFKPYFWANYSTQRITVMLG